MTDRTTIMLTVAGLTIAAGLYVVNKRRSLDKGKAYNPKPAVTTPAATVKPNTKSVIDSQPSVYIN